MKIAIATDHNGVNEKKELIRLLSQYDFLDKSPINTDTDDYPDFAFEVANSVTSKEADLGVLLCGTGIGIGIAANKVPGIRAALCSDTFSAHATREHNDANILTLGQRVVGPGLALDIVKTFLHTKFEGGRHVNRIDKISEIEKKYNK